MYLDVLGPDNYGTYHRKLAKITNILTAVYWQELLDVVSKVVKKKKFDENGFFKLDRKYLEDRTNLTTEMQLDSESLLIRLDVLTRSETDPDMISVNLENMTKVLISDDVKQLTRIEKSITKISRSQKAADKKAAVLITMKRCVAEQDPDIKVSYENWIDSVYASGRFVTKAKIQAVEQKLEGYTKEEKLKILEVGIQTGWTEPDWLINKLNGQFGTKLNTAQKISTSVNTDISF